MSSRRQGRPHRRPPSDGVPLIPVLLAVVLVGLVLGAALSTVGYIHDEVSGSQVTAAPGPTDALIPTPAPSPSRFLPRLTPYPAVVPTMQHTPRPKPRPHPSVKPLEPTPRPSPKPLPATPKPSVMTLPTLTPERTSAPTSAPTLLLSVPASPTPSAQAVTMSAPHLSPVPTLQPKRKLVSKRKQPEAAPSQAAAAVSEAMPEPTATPEPTPVPVPTLVLEVDSEFGGEAARAVRAYLSAVRHTDEAAAYAMLAKGLSLSEESFMDADARLTRIHASATSVSAVVQVDMLTARGPYVLTFSVERGPKGPIITSHDFVKEK